MKYIQETYDELLSRGYGYSAKEQQSEDWRLMKRLYEQYYLQCDDALSLIPKKIHHVWIGGGLPKIYQRFIDSWKHYHPDWEFRLWGDKDANVLLKGNRAYETSINNGMKSDLLRYQVLYNEGGVYIDTDFECLKPIDDLMYLKFFTGLSYDSLLVYYIGLIGSVPQHPIMKYCMKEAREYVGHNGMVVMDATGNYHFTRSFLKGVKEDEDRVVAFPPDFFYPLPNNQRGHNEPNIFIRPCSYAIHHWAVSWIPQNKQI